jgi:hypothetical protein
MVGGYKLIYVFIYGRYNTIFQWDNFHCDKLYCSEKTNDVTIVVTT